jgi:hypothetical protein
MREPPARRGQTVARMLHDRRPAVERWFLRRGLPHLIDDYTAREDIFTRMVPFISGLFAVEVALSAFGDRFTGGQQAVVSFGAVAVSFGVWSVVNLLRGRRAWQRPERVGPVEAGVFLVVPPAVAATFGSHPALEVPLLLAGNVVVLAVAYPITSYGIVPMTRWVFSQLQSQLRHMSLLMVRTLPLLLLFSAFLFLNAEVWQVANDFAWPFFVAVLAGIVLLGSVFLALAQRTDIDDIARFDDWREVCALCSGSPLEGVDPGRFAGTPDPPPLSSRARRNVHLVMFVSQSIQVLLVGAVTFVFYVLFGLLTVREETVSQWIADGELPARDRYAELTVGGHGLVLSRQLVVVAGFIAGFAALQFLVQLVNDATYRERFAKDMAAEARQVLAVRAAYLAA